MAAAKARREDGHMTRQHALASLARPFTFYNADVERVRAKRIAASAPPPKPSYPPFKANPIPATTLEVRSYMSSSQPGSNGSDVSLLTLWKSESLSRPMVFLELLDATLLQIAQRSLALKASADHLGRLPELHSLSVKLPTNNSHNLLIQTSTYRAHQPWYQFTFW